MEELLEQFRKGLEMGYLSGYMQAIKDLKDNSAQIERNSTEYSESVILQIKEKLKG